MAPDDRRTPQYRRQQEYEEITAWLRILRAADFDLGNPENADDERLLTRILSEQRQKFERKERWRSRRSGAGKWLAMALGGAVITIFGPDFHEWLRSHFP